MISVFDYDSKLQNFIISKVRFVIKFESQNKHKKN